MKKILIICCVILSSMFFYYQAEAAAITSAQAGNWSSASTWVGGVVPGNGDTATISHAVTVDTNTTVGTSPSNSSTVVLTLNAPITIANGVTFTVRGNVAFSYTDSFVTAMTLGAGSKLVMDPTQASVRSSAKYKLAVTADWMANKIVANGTSGAHAQIYTLRTNGDEPRAYFSNAGFFGSGQWDITYTDITDIGDASTNASEHCAAGTYRFINSTFTRVGAFADPFTCNLAGSATFQVIDTVFDQSPGPYNLAFYTVFSLTSGTREIRRSVFDKGFGPIAGSFTFLDFTVTHNLIYTNGIITFGGPSALWQWNVIIRTGLDEINACDNMKDTFIIDDSSSANPHFITMGNCDTTYDGMILYDTRGGNDGDGLIKLLGTDKFPNIINSIILPRGDDQTWSSATLATPAAGSKMGNIWHNTVKGDSAALYNHGVQIGEGGVPAIPTILSYKSNIYWDTSARGQAIRAYNGSTPDDVVTASTITNNTNYNALAVSRPGKTSDGSYYDIGTTVGTPGLNDVNVNPGFVDTTRNPEKWATTMGGSATISSFASILKQNLLVNIPALFSYVRAGFAPTNVALKGAAHDGGDIGAVAVVDTVAPTVSVTTPTNSSTVGGITVSLAASASDGFGVAGVKFYIDAVQVGSEDTTAPYSINWDSTSVSDGSHSVTAVARDAAGNSTTSSSVSITVDNTPPTRSSGSPSTQLSSNTTNTDITLNTNENATCKYSTTSGTSYGSMQSFSTTGSMAHSVNVAGLSNGQSYNYYVRCQDSYGNSNSTDYTISFSIASPVVASGARRIFIPTNSVASPENMVSKLSNTKEVSSGSVVTNTNYSLGSINKHLFYSLKGEEVKKLQMFLNQDPDTKVSEKGAGSPGKETSFFGKKTMDAVRRFQEKYAKEILDPFGLKFGNGYVGDNTLKKINSLINTSN